MAKNLPAPPIKTTFPIDLVYLWCDDADQAWRAKRRSFDTSRRDADDVGACRFRSNDELRFSLRSVEQNAPWFNHIYIVTDGQTPPWLDTSNPKISVVDHKDIIDPRYLPLFSSSAIETSIYKIPGLSEHFVFANDDFFIAKPVRPEDFFPREGHAILRMKKSKLMNGTNYYRRHLYQAQKVIEKRFGVKLTLMSHHNMDGYLLSDYRDCMEYYADWVADTLSHRFRYDKSIPRHLVGDYMWCVGHATIEKYSRYAFCTGWLDRARCFLTGRFKANSKQFQLHHKDFDKLYRKYGMTFLSLNDDASATDADLARAHSFMERTWPLPSQFEKIPV